MIDIISSGMDRAIIELERTFENSTPKGEKSTSRDRRCSRPLVVNTREINIAK